MNNRFRILLLFIVDSLLVVGSVFLGFRLVTEGLIRNIHGLTITAILSLIAYYIFSYFFNLYWRDWEYASVYEVITVVKCVSATVIVSTISGLAFFDTKVTWQFLIVCWLLLVISIGGVRLSMRVFREFFADTSVMENAKPTLIVGAGAAGIGAGVAVAALGPTTAMGVATTFGVASTGTAISSLSGAAATNAALAWLGGGALTAGGGGMAAGSAFLALAGPVGWVIAGVATLTSGLMFWKSKSDKKEIENIFTHISKRDINSYKLAIVELSERIVRVGNETKMLKDAVIEIKSFGTDYNTMTEAQQYKLGAYLNLMLSSTQLLVNPIMGLQPKFSDNDFDRFLSWKGRKSDEKLCNDFKLLIISLSNLLYKIDLDDRDKKLLYKTFRKNKEMLSALEIKKKDFTLDIINAVEEALSYSYK